MLFKSLIKIKIQFTSRLDYIDIIAYHFIILNVVPKNLIFTDLVDQDQVDPLLFSLAQRTKQVAQ